MSNIRCRKTLGALLFLGVCASACSGKPFVEYEVRAVIVAVAPENHAVQLLHEAIPAFQDEEGNVVGMSPMAMTFGTPAGLALSDFQPGDKVQVRFAVRWNRNPRLLIINLVKLSPETALELGGTSIEPER